MFVKKNNLNYYVFAGTLLGAVRHRGIIPWDDDVDVCMPREDYEILLENASLFSGDYFLRTPISDPGYHKAFARLRFTPSTEIQIDDAIFDINHGVFIDIFPMDNVIDDVNKQNKQYKKRAFYNGLLQVYGRIYGNVGTIGLSTKKAVLYYLIKFLDRIGVLTLSNVWNKFNKTASKYNNINCEKWGPISFCYSNERFIYKKSLYEETCYLEFDGKMLRCPKEWDEVLRTSYGDYMVPVKQRSEHGDVIIDTKTAYKKYIEDNRLEIKNKWLENRTKSKGEI